MRLTLRTLLAYLDDRLEPADAKAIGEKIAESPVAPAMVDRIREVLRRRRVAAPQISGPGSGPDPNLVAEYLDLTLPPEHVAEIERICLESDLHLAEVAATHQILTLVLGEAVDIPQTMRERMYALGMESAPPADDNGHGRGRILTDAAPERSTVATVFQLGEPESSSLAERLPSELRRRPLWRRLMPIAVPVVVIAWLSIVLPDFFSDPRHRAEPAPAVAQAGSPSNDGSNTAEPPAPIPQDTGTSQPVSPSETPDPGDSVDAPSTNANPPEANPLPATVPLVAGPANQATPASTTVTTPAETTQQPPAGTAVAVAPATVAPEVAPPPVVAPSIMYKSVEGVLLQYQPDDADWVVMPRRALVHPGDELACPEPFTAVMSIDEGRCELVMNSGTSLGLLAPTVDGEAHLDVRRGKLGLYRANAGQPVQCRVRVGGADYQIELLERETLCGIEVIPRPCQGLPDGPMMPAYDGGVFVDSGAVRLTRPDGQELEWQNNSGWLPWHAAGGGAPEPGPLLAIPQWLVPGGPSLPAISRPGATQYEREFVLDEPISYSIPAIVKDRRPRMSEYAVQTLALTDNYSQLLRALGVEHTEARRAAIMGLRRWLPEAAGNGPLLKQEIEHDFRDEDVDIVYRLLWGYTQDDARNPDASRKLVSWLSHEDIAIRELACMNLLEVTGRDNDYQPMAPLVQRQAAIARWVDHVERYGALLPPLETQLAP